MSIWNKYPSFVIRDKATYLSNKQSYEDKTDLPTQVEHASPVSQPKKIIYQNKHRKFSRTRVNSKHSKKRKLLEYKDKLERK